MIFKLTTGSVFEILELDLDAIMIFVPGGLTAMRFDTDLFIEEECFLIKELDFFHLYQFKNASSPKFILIHKNEANVRIEESHAIALLRGMLKWSFENNIKKIGMNGIRLQSDFVVPEKWLIEEVKNILRISEFTFDKVEFVDKRGGFNKI